MKTTKNCTLKLHTVSENTEIKQCAVCPKSVQLVCSLFTTAHCQLPHHDSALSPQCAVVCSFSSWHSSLIVYIQTQSKAVNAHEASIVPKTAHYPTLHPFRTRKRTMPEHATTKTCPNCHTTILTTNHDYIYRVELHPPFEADPTQLDPNTVTSCIIIGRKTYNLTTTPNGHHYLTGMTPTNIKHRKKWYDSLTWHTLPAHRCHQPLPGTPIPNLPTPKTKTTTDNKTTDPNQLNLTPHTPWGAHNPNTTIPNPRPF